MRELVTSPLASRLSAGLFLFAADTKDASGFMGHAGDAKEIGFLHHRGLGSRVGLWEPPRALETAGRRVVVWPFLLGNVAGHGCPAGRR